MNGTAGINIYSYEKTGVAYSTKSPSLTSFGGKESPSKRSLKHPPLKKSAKPTTGFAICSPDALNHLFVSDQSGLPGSSLRMKTVYLFGKKSQSPKDKNHQYGMETPLTVMDFGNISHMTRITAVCYLDSLLSPSSTPEVSPKSLRTPQGGSARRVLIQQIRLPAIRCKDCLMENLVR